MNPEEETSGFWFTSKERRHYFHPHNRIKAKHHSPSCICQRTEVTGQLPCWKLQRWVNTVTASQEHVSSNWLIPGGRTWELKTSEGSVFGDLLGEEAQGRCLSTLCSYLFLQPCFHDSNSVLARVTCIKQDPQRVHLLGHNPDYFLNQKYLELLLNCSHTFSFFLIRLRDPGRQASHLILLCLALSFVQRRYWISAEG